MRAVTARCTRFGRRLRFGRRALSDRPARLAALAVMLALVPFILVGADLPRPDGWVTDAAGVLTAAERQQIEDLAQRLQDDTGAELAVVTVVSIGGADSAQYAGELFDAWGIGARGEDTGVLLLLVTGEEERSVRIEVGYGLEGAIPDGLAGRILDEHVVPALQDGEPGRALLAGAQALSDRIRAELGAGDGRERSVVSEPEIDDVAALVIFAGLFFGIVTAVVVLSQLLRRRCPNCRTRVRTRQEVLQAPTQLVPGTALLHYVCRKCGWTEAGKTVRLPATGYSSGPRRGGWGGAGGTGRGGFGGSRGGFGGFGGGRGGGGGAGRRW